MEQNNWEDEEIKAATTTAMEIKIALFLFCYWMWQIKDNYLKGCFIKKTKCHIMDRILYKRYSKKYVLKVYSYKIGWMKVNAASLNNRI